MSASLAAMSAGPWWSGHDPWMQQRPTCTIHDEAVGAVFWNASSRDQLSIGLRAVMSCSSPQEVPAAKSPDVCGGVITAAVDAREHLAAACGVDKHSLGLTLRDVGHCLSPSLQCRLKNLNTPACDLRHITMKAVQNLLKDLQCEIGAELLVGDPFELLSGMGAQASPDGEGQVFVEPTRIDISFEGISLLQELLQQRQTSAMTMLNAKREMLNESVKLLPESDSEPLQESKLYPLRIGIHSGVEFSCSDTIDSVFGGCLGRHIRLQARRAFAAA
jgi:hypothetical protein